MPFNFCEYRSRNIKWVWASENETTENNTRRETEKRPTPYVILNKTNRKHKTARNATAKTDASVTRPNTLSDALSYVSKGMTPLSHTAIRIFLFHD